MDNNIRHIIKEAIGVSEDVKNLSEFIFSFLSNEENRNELEKNFFLGDISKDQYKLKRAELDAEEKKAPKRRIFTKNDLPPLKDINIEKLIIDLPKTVRKKGELGHFNAGKSYKGENGIVVYLKFYGNVSKSTIYHELTHVLQYQKLGSQKMAQSLKPVKKVGFSTGFVTKGMTEEEREVIDYFAYYVYQSQEHEITAKVTETYSTLKERIKNSSFSKHKNDRELTNILFKTFMEGTYGWTIANRMINYDIFEEFKKLDDNTTINFFSYIKDMEKYVRMEHETWPRVKEIFSIIMRSMALNRNPKKLKVLSEDEVIRIMKEYNDYINKQGYKMKRKLSKLYAHFV